MREEKKKKSMMYEQKETVYPFSTEGMLDEAFKRIRCLEKCSEKLENNLATLEALVMNQINNIKYYINQINKL